MSEEERLRLLVELREKFREARPDLNLPPARQETLEEAIAREEERQRKEAAAMKMKSLEETAKQNPKTIAKMLKKFTGGK